MTLDDRTLHQTNEINNGMRGVNNTFIDLLLETTTGDMGKKIDMLKPVHHRSGLVALRR